MVLAGSQLGVRGYYFFYSVLYPCHPCVTLVMPGTGIRIQPTLLWLVSPMPRSNSPPSPSSPIQKHPLSTSILPFCQPLPSPALQTHPLQCWMLGMLQCWELRIQYTSVDSLILWHFWVSVGSLHLLKFQFGLSAHREKGGVNIELIMIINNNKLYM